MATSFENWFSSDWQKALREIPVDTDVLSSGFSISTSSWDRRAGYLLWNALGRPNAAWVEQMRPVYDKKSNTTGEPVKESAKIEHNLDDLLGGSPTTAVAPPADDLEDLLG